MVMQAEFKSTTATEAEIAAAAQEAADALRREEVKDGERVSGVAAMPELAGAIKPMQYKIPVWDQGSWVMVWEMKIDADGGVYGDPTKAPRQQLGLWLQKKRADGGPRFQVEMPTRLRAQAVIPCLYNGPEGCTKKFYTRQDMVEHVDATHPRFARINQPILQSIMDKVAEDNPRLAQMAEAISNMTDRGLVSVEVNPTPRTDRVDPTLGTPTVTQMGLGPTEYKCAVAECGWPTHDKWKDWSEQQKAQFLHTHTLSAHKDDL